MKRLAAASRATLQRQAVKLSGFRRFRNYKLSNVTIKANHPSARNRTLPMTGMSYLRPRCGLRLLAILRYTPIRRQKENILRTWNKARTTESCRGDALTARLAESWDREGWNNGDGVETRGA